MPIPTIVMEEHNEAFLAWNAARLFGILPATGNSLLHVDEHSDFQAPRLRRPLHEVLDDLPRIAEFTYTEISIAEFIVPAVYQGLFDSFCWVKQGVIEPQQQDLFVFSLDNVGRLLLLSPKRPENSTDARPCRFTLQSPRHPVRPNDSIVLDIDLDFFSCDQSLNHVDRLEVTRAEYERLQSDKRHFLRLNHGSQVSAREANGRYYVHFRDYEGHVVCPHKMPPEAIQARRTLLQRCLSRNHVRPRIITIARSRLTGFTPADQWQDIEAGLLDTLSSLFDLELFTIESFTGRC